MVLISILLLAKINYTCNCMIMKDLKCLIGFLTTNVGVNEFRLYIFYYRTLIPNQQWSYFFCLLVLFLASVFEIIIMNQ